MVSVEKRNKPTVMLCKDGFLGDARSAASVKAMPQLKIIPETIPCECTVMEQVESGVDKVFDDIISALTKPLTAEELHPVKQPVKTAGIIFKGNFKEINQFFYRRGMGDGLPLVPPTEEAVAEMLTGTDLSPDYLIGKLPPRAGKATVRNIAINAVMAGALPTYMPVIIAMVRAFIKTHYFGGQSISGGSWAPAVFVNGPIRKDININSGLGLLSPGDMANSTLGRTLQLIIRNIAGIRKGVEDMGNYGNPGRYSMVLAENEEESPWEPLHVQQGININDSAVTVTHPSSTLMTHGGPHVDTNPDALLKMLCYHFPPPEGAATFLINPTLARILACGGWNKADMADFIAEYARVPLYQLSHYWVSGVNIPRRTGIFAHRLNEGKQAMLLNVKNDPMASIPKISSTEMIRFVVCGGFYATMCILLGGPVCVSQKIEIPQNWDSLVKKYKDIKPTYALY
jgi:hypothetical protein